MPVHRESQTIFYHIPKCAGSGVEEMFGMRTVPNLFLPEFGTVEYNGVKFSLQHLTPMAVESLYPEFSGFASYAITRNPYEKAVASYCWLRTKHEKAQFFRFRENRFIKWLNNYACHFEIDHTLPQSYWASNVDHKFDISGYDAATQAMSKRIGIPVRADLRHSKRNKLDTKKIVQSLSQKSLDEIYKIYEVDFDMLHYSKGLIRH